MVHEQQLCRNYPKQHIWGPIQFSCAKEAEFLQYLKLWVWPHFLKSCMSSIPLKLPDLNFSMATMKSCNCSSCILIQLALRGSDLNIIFLCLSSVPRLHNFWINTAKVGKLLKNIHITILVNNTFETIAKIFQDYFVATLKIFEVWRTIKLFAFSGIRTAALRIFETYVSNIPNQHVTYVGPCESKILQCLYFSPQQILSCLIKNST